MAEKVNLAEKLAAFDEPFAPKIIGCFSSFRAVSSTARGPMRRHTSC